jgi:hypothetical protein
MSRSLLRSIGFWRSASLRTRWPLERAQVEERFSFEGNVTELRALFADVAP